MECSIEKNLNKITVQLESIEKRLDKIEKTSDKIKVSCKNMDDHASWVESVYNRLRYPLNWITGLVSGRTHNLPQSRGYSRALDDIACVKTPDKITSAVIDGNIMKILDDGCLDDNK